MSIIEYYGDSTPGGVIRYWERKTKHDCAREILRCWNRIEELEKALTQQQDDTHGFKNFHKNLCERFGYGHDEIDWRRDQVSLIEHIAAISQQQEVEPLPMPETDGNGCVHTGNSEADAIINRLNSDDPTFEAMEDAVAFIYKLVSEHKGPDGYATWKDAAIAERVQRAAQPQVPEGYALTPIEPADGLLISMACRDRHDFGLLPRGMQESIMGSMRQVHQEVVGAGFYNPDKEAEYKSMLSAAQSVTMDDAIAAGDGTIHGAIDYWQERALKAEAAQPQVPDADETYKRFCEWCDYHKGYDLDPRLHTHSGNKVSDGAYISDWVTSIAFRAFRDGQLSAAKEGN